MTSTRTPPPRRRTWTEDNAPEISANNLRIGDSYAEPGMDPVRVRSTRRHGDTVLITGTRGEREALDIDTVVALVARIITTPPAAG